jgi:hypothetical protein
MKPRFASGHGLRLVLATFNVKRRAFDAWLKDSNPAFEQSLGDVTGIKGDERPADGG